MPFAQGDGIAQGRLGGHDLILGTSWDVGWVLQGAGPAQAWMVSSCPVQEGGNASAFSSCLPARHTPFDITSTRLTRGCSHAQKHLAGCKPCPFQPLIFYCNVLSAA